MSEESLKGGNNYIPESSLDNISNGQVLDEKKVDSKEFKEKYEKDILSVKTQEKIDNELGAFFNSINISKEDIEVIFKELLKYGDDEEKLNKIIFDIKDLGLEAKGIEDIKNIINESVNDYKLSEKELSETDKNTSKIDVKDVKNKSINNLDYSLKNVEGLKDSVAKLTGGEGNYSEILKNINILSIDKLKTGDNSEIENIVKLLKTDNNALYHISKDLKKQDELNKTDTFGQFSSSLINMDSSFREKFDLINTDLVSAKQKTVLGVENLGGMNISGNVLRINPGDGYVREAGKDGRKLFLEGSDYKLDSKINNGGALREISSIEEEFKKEMEEINRELDTLIAIMEYVNDAITNNVELSVVKQTIKSQNVNLYNEMNLDSLTSLEHVKNAFVVMIKQKEEEKEKKIKEKKGIIDEIVRQNALNAKEIDEKKKEILKFLHQIKFDMLPKDLTDQIINEYKSNIFGIPGLNLNKDTLDLTNGKFGEGVNESGGDRWKDNLVKFMEKMIYGQIGAKESIFNGKQFKGELGANIDPLLINAALEQNGIKTELGWNINVIRNNLKKENTSK